MTNILEYLEHTAKKAPYRTAFSDGETAMTFREVHDQARAVGTALHEAGFYKQPVVVFMGKHPRTLTAFFGAIYGGNYYVPLDAEMPRHRIDLILETLKPAALIYDETTAEQAKTLAFTGTLYAYESLAFGAIDEKRLTLVRRQQLDIDPIYIVFTSGSTGIPKGVMGCHRGVIDYIEALCPVMRFDENTVFGNQTPLYFDAFLKEVIPTLKFGAATVLIPRSLFLFPVKLVEFLNEHKINTLCWVVSALTFVSSLGTFDKVVPKYLRTVAFASEVFPIRQFNIWKKTLPDVRFVNLYGPTETTGICCYYEVNREFEENEALPIGGPFPNTQVLLLDENDRLAEAGEQGEICIRGTRLTLGYFRDPERTAAAFVQNPLNDLYPETIYRTGDLGKYNDRGELIFLSRKDSQIKHMGHRIELGEIEAVANWHEDVSGACALYDGEKKRITLFYTGNVESHALSAYLKEKLPRYMLPQILRRLDEMPLTPNGKIDRNLLKSQG